jgi:hypothetical protein
MFPVCDDSLVINLFSLESIEKAKKIGDKYSNENEIGDDLNFFLFLTSFSTLFTIPWERQNINCSFV